MLWTQTRESITIMTSINTAPKEVFMESIGIVIIIMAVAIPLIMFQTSRYEGLIQDRVQSMGGRYLSHDREWGLIGAGPYKLVGKGQTVYRITYELEGTTKEGWVKFGGLMGPDWRM